MAITLQKIHPVAGEIITLPKDLQWINEFDYSSIVHSVERGVTGALFIQESEKLEGREIILAGKPDMGWITRTDLEKIQLLKESIGITMQLSLPNDDIATPTIEFFVIFNYSAGNPLVVETVKGFDYYKKDDYYNIKAMSFLTVVNPS